MDSDGEIQEGGNTDFAGFTAPANAPGQAESRVGKAVLDAHLATLPERPAWATIYEDLMAEQVETDGKLRHRWDWRKSLYIAWSVVPRGERFPKTEQELAQLMRLSSTRVFRAWKEKDPEIAERIARLPKKMLTSHIADVYNALVAVAASPVPAAHQDRKMFLEMVGEYQTKLALTGANDGPVRFRYDLSNLTDDELEELDRIASRIIGDQGREGATAPD